MTSLFNVISYICSHHPDGYNLSVERLIKILYLVDWKNAIINRTQMMPISWEIKDFEPWMDEDSIKQFIEFLARLRMGESITKIQSLSEAEKEVIDYVIETSRSKENENELTRLVYSTYPAIAENNVSGAVDLPSLALKYEKLVKPILKQ